MTSHASHVSLATDSPLSTHLRYLQDAPLLARTAGTRASMTKAALEDLINFYSETEAHETPLKPDRTAEYIPLQQLPTGTPR